MIDKIKKYAEFLVKSGINLQKGEKLRVFFSIDSIQLAREIVKEAYKNGAIDVKSELIDKQIQDARIIYGSDASLDTFYKFHADYLETLVKEGYHEILIDSYDKPNENINVEKVIRFAKVRSTALKEVKKLKSANAIKWCIAPYISRDWAELIYPDIALEDAEQKLFNDFMKITLMTATDPIKAWEDHDEELKNRVLKLNEYKFDRLHFKDDETDVVIGLALDAKWEGGREKYKDGREYMPNIPTEEVFTMPHKFRVDGHVKIRKPFVLYGKEITDIELDFKEGRIIGFKTNGYDDLFKGLLDRDEGSKYLGEVALVDKSSPINAYPNVFFNTLLDENAACHIAIGDAYEETTTSKLEDKNEIGWNESLVHEDIMLGSDTLKVVGYTKDEKEVVIMENGSFTDEFRTKK